ncbi:7653_t:CDS:2 [Cetraspora pellucida]|uniref:7653_t:CDS:1 n=1 Tax=Cetraspora pellucida TaxID=1433469 RepID=A0A9N9DVN0_9GLOM|nr:7653_t:CDS:2 [Cetraspora pellucida]
MDMSQKMIVIKNIIKNIFYIFILLLTNKSKAEELLSQVLHS